MEQEQETQEYNVLYTRQNRELEKGKFGVIPFDLRTNRAPASTSFWCSSICKEIFCLSDFSCSAVELGSWVPIPSLLL